MYLFSYPIFICSFNDDFAYFIAQEDRSSFHKLIHLTSIYLSHYHYKQHTLSVNYHFNMETPTPPLLTQIRQAIHQHHSETVKQFSKTLFPVISTSSPAENLLNAIHTYFVIHLNKDKTFDTVTQEVQTKSQQYPELIESIKQLFSDGAFLSKLKAKVMSSREMSRGSLENKEEKSTEIVDLDTFIPTPPTSARDGSIRSGRRKNGGNDSKKQLNGKPNQNVEIDIVNNLFDKGLCLCERQVKEDDVKFHCGTCERTFHCQCMKRKSNITSCVYCQLKLMIPNRQVKKVLFFGVLKKNRRRHQFLFNLGDQDLSMRHRLQFRSFRLKDTANNLILFPDTAGVHVNSQRVKEFQPLHKQSCLKFRKDEPFFVQAKHLVPKINRVVITQRLPSKEHRDERNDIENHLVGLFMVEQRKVDPLFNQIVLNCFTSFNQSKNILDSSFSLSSFEGEEVTCQVVKIPLTCTLTTEKIKWPARGSFCTHFQCFDLYNFLRMISQSNNPRWHCPMCKLPCYQFKIDVLLSAILKKFESQGATEVMFFKNGQFSIHSNDLVLQDQQTRSIFDLQIEGQGKRAAQQIIQQPQRRKKRTAIPEGISVIDLD